MSQEMEDEFNDIVICNRFLVEATNCKYLLICNHF